MPLIILIAFACVCFAFVKSRKKGHSHYIETRPAVLIKHYDLIQKYESLYKGASKDGVYSPKMGKVIKLCLEDVGLANQCYVEFKKEGHIIPNYPSYDRLRIIYTKQKDYDKAIDICQQCIEAGYDNGGKYFEHIQKLKQKGGSHK